MFNVKNDMKKKGQIKKFKDAVTFSASSCNTSNCTKGTENIERKISMLIKKIDEQERIIRNIKPEDQYKELTFKLMNKNKELTNKFEEIFNENLEIRKEYSEKIKNIEDSYTKEFLEYKTKLEESYNEKREIENKISSIENQQEHSPKEDREFIIEKIKKAKKKVNYLKKKSNIDNLYKGKPTI